MIFCKSFSNPGFGICPDRQGWVLLGHFTGAESYKELLWRVGISTGTGEASRKRLGCGISWDGLENDLLFAAAQKSGRDVPLGDPGLGQPGLIGCEATGKPYRLLPIGAPGKTSQSLPFAIGSAINEQRVCLFKVPLSDR